MYVDLVDLTFFLSKLTFFFSLLQTFRHSYFTYLERTVCLFHDFDGFCAFGLLDC